MQPSSTPQPGLHCPQCDFFISFSLPDLLYGNEKVCPGCGLHLTMNRERSRTSLELLQEIYVAAQNLEGLKAQKL